MCFCFWPELREISQGVLWELSALIWAPAHVVLVGLEWSGKTTVLFRLKYGQYVNAVPTVGFNTEKVRSGGGSWLIWDVGGAERVRPLWRSYTRATDGLIFVVDSSGPNELLEEARVELQRLIKQQSSECANLNRPKPPLLVLANKQDLPSARDCEFLKKALGLSELPVSQPWAVAPACAVTGEGLEEAMSCLQQMIAKVRSGRAPPSLLKVVV